MLLVLHCSPPEPRRGLAPRKLRGPRPELNRRGFQEVTQKWSIEWYDLSYKQKEVTAIAAMTAATSSKPTCKKASMIQCPFQTLTFADPTSKSLHPMPPTRHPKPKTLNTKVAAPNPQHSDSHGKGVPRELRRRWPPTFHYIRIYV